MNIETVIALIASVGGLAGLISAVSTVVFKIMEYRKAQRGETLDAKLDTKLQPILDELHSRQKENLVLQGELREIRLDTTRTQMIMLMEHQPQNHDTILKIAERYFCVLKGDWYCTSLFKEWAKKEKIEIPNTIYQATKNHE